MSISIGIPELVVILILVAVVFGTARLGRAGRVLGAATKDFRQAELEAEHGLASDDTFATRDEKLLVFLSSVMREAIEDLSPERTLIAKILAADTLFTLWRFEDAPANDELEQSYLSPIEDCHIFIIIVGTQMTNAVETELALAVKCKKPILAFLKRTTQARSESAEALIRRLVNHGVRYKEFGTSEELKREVVRALYHCVIKYYKRGLTRETYILCLQILKDLHDTDVPESSLFRSDRTRAGTGGDMDTSAPRARPSQPVSNGTFTVERLARVLDAMLPRKFKDFAEDYQDLLGDLRAFGIDTESKLIDLLDRRYEEMMQWDARDALRDGRHCTHTGLVRTAIDIEFDGKWTEIEKRGHKDW